MTNVAETIWFDIDLETLCLRKVNLNGWPEGMTRSGSRMKEECLEYVETLSLRQS